MILLDVRRIGARVRLEGVTAASNAGRPVSIRLKSGDSIVARSTVQADGSFVTRAELPPLGIRKTNRARYRAEVDGAVSPFLKLARRMRVVGLDTRAGRITIAGKITLPLAKPVATIRVRQRTRCAGAGRVVARVRPGQHGRFQVSFRRPRGVDAAVYRLDTFVRKHAKHRRHYKRYATYALPRGVDLF